MTDREIALRVASMLCRLAADQLYAAGFLYASAGLKGTAAELRRPAPTDFGLSFHYRKDEGQ